MPSRKKKKRKTRKTRKRKGGMLKSMFTKKTSVPVPSPVLSSTLSVTKPSYNSKKAPVNMKDPRVLGKGKFKFAWIRKLDDEQRKNRSLLERMVVVNSFEDQRTRTKNSDNPINIEKAKTESDEIIRNEYAFTDFLKDTTIEYYILEVSDIDEEIEPTGHFRYLKQRCIKMPTDDNTFDIMIRISDNLIDEGWTYLDMKPENLGLIDHEPTIENTMIVDTDPDSFYMIPDRYIELYKACCHMIILLHCYNNIKTITHKHMRDFISNQKYTLEKFKDYYNEASLLNDTDNDTIVSHNVKNENIYILNGVQLPRLFIDHYGSKKAIQKDQHGKDKEVRIPIPMELLEALIENRSIT